MSQQTRNYHAHGGNEWVVGGKLTILPGAVVEGMEPSLPSSIANQPQSTATTVATLKDDFNALLTKLKSAGYMVADTPDSEAE